MRKPKFQSKALTLISDNNIMKFYLSNRTKIATIMPTNRIKPPAEIKIGTAKPISSVASFSGLGNRTGVKVASSKPSGYFSMKQLVQASKQLLETMKYSITLTMYNS